MGSNITNISVKHILNPSFQKFNGFTGKIIKIKPIKLKSLI